MKKRLCKIFGCNKLAIDEKGFCAVHRWPDKDKTKEKVYNNQRAGTQKHYNYKWQQFRKRLIAQHPYCAICGSTDHLVLDHKDIPAQVMIDMYGKFVLEDYYYQVLCNRHNTIKQREDQIKIDAYFKAKKENLIKLED